MLNPTILGLTKLKRNKVLAVLFIKESRILFYTFFDPFLLVFHDNSVYFMITAITMLFIIAFRTKTEYTVFGFSTTMPTFCYSRDKMC